MRPGGFSVSMNSRDKGGSVVENMWQFVRYGKSAWTPTILARDLLQKGYDFEKAKSVFATTRLVNGCYYVVGDGSKPHSGAIISRERPDADDIWPIGGVSDSHPNVTIDVQPDWFRLQTNYDHWEVCPSWDNRRDPGVAHVKAIGGPQSVTWNAIHQVITAYPTKSQYTDVTSIMMPANGSIWTVVWHPA